MFKGNLGVATSAEGDDQMLEPLDFEDEPDMYHLGSADGQEAAMDAD